MSTTPPAKKPKLTTQSVCNSKKITLLLEMFHSIETKNISIDEMIVNLKGHSNNKIIYSPISIILGRLICGTH